MSRSIHRLTARSIQAAKTPGRLSDGGNLYLNIAKGGSKSWAFIYRDRATQKPKELGLGSANTVSLADARARAAELRQQLAAGLDPKSQRKEITRAPTFGEFASIFIDAQEPSWRNEKHRQQWRNTIATYCAPIANIPIDKVGREDVLGILRPIWQIKAETASRLRGRIEKILDAARAQGFREGENPARWKGHLELILPRRQKLQRGHHPAMPYSDLPDFMVRLRANGSVSAKALEFIILTGARSGMVLRSKRDDLVEGMLWDEVDFEGATWTVPGRRMKSGAAFRVPLSAAARAIISEMREIDGRFVFPGQRSDQPLSESACAEVMKRMNAKPATVHGFRTSFRTWAAEMTEAPDWVAEMALAHTVGSAVERAYRRTDAFQKRRQLMDQWAAYLELGSDLDDAGTAEAD